MKRTKVPGNKYWLALIAAMTAAVITYFMMRELGPLLVQNGLINSWSSIKSPPSGIASILGATDGAYKQYDDLWIKTRDGQILSASVCTGYSQPCGDLPQWKSISKVPVYSLNYTRGTDCKKLGEFPLNPSGQIAECRYYFFWENDLATIIYYALMADGSLKYFVMDFSVQLKIQLIFFLVTVLLYFVMLILVFRLTNYVAEQIQTGRQPR